MIYSGDAIDFLKGLSDSSVDLIVTDPPYDIKNTTPGGNSGLAKSMKNYNDQLSNLGLSKCQGINWCQEIKRIQGGKINCYIWCNKAQIPIYFKYFIDELKCSFDIIVWYKPNTPPTFYNKWMSDKEYCLYFRKGAYCMPGGYSDASTLFTHPTNAKDKKLYNHPTVKPLEIIKRLIRNSSKPGQTVIDPFMGSGTTGVASILEGRCFKGSELNPSFVETSKQRMIQATIDKLNVPLVDSSVNKV